VFFLDEEPSQPCRRHFGFDAVGIQALARGRDRIRIDVRGEELQLDVAVAGGNPLMEEHGEGIGFLARAATRNPDAQSAIGCPAVEQAGNHLLFQQVEHVPIAEKAGDVDQEVLREQIQFAPVGAQPVEIAVHIVGRDRSHLHAPFDPALQRTGFVEGKIVRRPGAQKLDDVRQPLRRLVMRGRAVLNALLAHLPIVHQQSIGNPRRR
jgi:hypothetical protein